MSDRSSVRRWADDSNTRATSSPCRSRRWPPRSLAPAPHAASRRCRLAILGEANDLAKWYGDERDRRRGVVAFDQLQRNIMGRVGRDPWPRGASLLGSGLTRTRADTPYRFLTAQFLASFVLRPGP